MSTRVATRHTVALRTNRNSHTFVGVIKNCPVCRSQVGGEPMRFRWVAVLAALFAITGVTNVKAQGQQGKAEPTIEIRLRSVDELINKAEYVTGLVGQDELVKQAR